MEGIVCPCPLWELISFFDLTDHCCMCGKDLGIKGVKQALCPDPFCLFGFLDIGVGSSVITELHRDQAAADLVISPASVANNPLG
jgi:poly [ADP-ribose] polymerase 6/8